MIVLKIVFMVVFLVGVEEFLVVWYFLENCGRVKVYEVFMDSRINVMEIIENICMRKKKIEK